MLILSLALNAFIAGGYFYSQFKDAHQQAQQPGRRLEKLAEVVGIDPKSSAQFRELRREFTAAQAVVWNKNRALSEVYWEELAKAQPDQKVLQDLVDKMNGNRHDFQMEVTNILVRFVGSLTQAQRDKLLEVIADRDNPLGAPVRNSVAN